VDSEEYDSLQTAQMNRPFDLIMCARVNFSPGFQAGTDAVNAKGSSANVSGVNVATRKNPHANLFTLKLILRQFAFLSKNNTKSILSSSWHHLCSNIQHT